MWKMDLQAVCRQPKTTVRHPGHKTWPYLLRSLDIRRPNHVWRVDITASPMRRGFLALVGVMDRASRRVWHGGRRTRWTPTSAVPRSKRRWLATTGRRSQRDAKQRRDYTDQGNQFTSPRFTGVRTEAGVRLSMGGRAGTVDGQSLHRAIIALVDVRVHLSPRLRNRLGRLHRQLSMVRRRHFRPIAFDTGRANAHQGPRWSRRHQIGGMTDQWLRLKIAVSLSCRTGPVPQPRFRFVAELPSETGHSPAEHRERSLVEFQPKFAMT